MGVEEVGELDIFRPVAAEARAGGRGGQPGRAEISLAFGGEIDGRQQKEQHDGDQDDPLLPPQRGKEAGMSGIRFGISPEPGGRPHGPRRITVQ